MELTAEQLKDIKGIVLDIFSKFIDVCNSLDLKYYVVEGTLLGAVRHQGFIPWDDDIDVGMPRADYEKFVAEGQKYLPEGYFLQAIETEKDFPCSFAKVRNSNTTFVEKSIKDSKINHGVYIDVFPLDYYPDDEREQKAFDRKNKFYSRRLEAEFYYEDLSIKRTLLYAIMKFIYPSTARLMQKRQELYRSVPPSNMIASYCGAWRKKEIVPADWYGEGTVLSFEGLRVSAPKEYDKWLTQVYGDYMQLPPEEERVPHHFVDVIDLERSYLDYRK